MKPVDAIVKPRPHDVGQRLKKKRGGGLNRDFPAWAERHRFTRTIKGHRADVCEKQPSRKRQKVRQRRWREGVIEEGECRRDELQNKYLGTRFRKEAQFPHSSSRLRAATKGLRRGESRQSNRSLSRQGGGRRRREKRAGRLMRNQ